MPPTRPLGRGEFHNHSGRERRLGAKNPGSGNFGQRMRARGAPSQTHTHFSPGLGKSPKAAPSAGKQNSLTEGKDSFHLTCPFSRHGCQPPPIEGDPVTPALEWTSDTGLLGCKGSCS
uniref:Ig-like domain-containing protein n=1 Tax=Mustela putorius furo TaxID=9669 RepID=M3YYD0_MUSPF